MWTQLLALSACSVVSWPWRALPVPWALRLTPQRKSRLVGQQLASIRVVV